MLVEEKMYCMFCVEDHVDRKDGFVSRERGLNSVDGRGEASLSGMNKEGNNTLIMKVSYSSLSRNFLKGNSPAYV